MYLGSAPWERHDRLAQASIVMSKQASASMSTFAAMRWSSRISSKVQTFLHVRLIALHPLQLPPWLSVH